jgi:NADPH:quinone reductase-like Zn-dependent oxidoreductase
MHLGGEHSTGASADTGQRTPEGNVAGNAQTTTMKAIVRDTYGAPDVLRLQDIDIPELADDGVLVRVRAVSVNRQDWYSVTGTPYIARFDAGVRKPKSRLVGTDFAGTVEAVGKDITAFRPGDEVFGGRSGSFAEYLCVRVGVPVNPPHVTFEEASTVPVAGLTALQGLRDKGQIRPGQHVLINGASGGVGTFAVQIAKALGAEVTAVCSTANVEQARSIGADHVVDYTIEDFTRSDQRHDLMFDNAGSRSWSHRRRVLNPRATVVLVGGPINRVVGPMGHVAKMNLAAVGRSQKAVFFIAKFNRPDMEFLRDLLDAGKVAPVIDRRYELSETADALRYVGEGHTKGKVVITV